MDLDPHKSLNPLNPGRGPLKPGRKSEAKKASKGSLESSIDPEGGIDYASTVFNGSELQEVIRQSLEAMPEVRRQLVESGRDLAEDENYPSAEDLDELGRLALRHFIQENQRQEEAS
jgi:hypothetical protein